MEEDPQRPGICICGQRMNMHEDFYCVPIDDDDEADELTPRREPS